MASERASAPAGQGADAGPRSASGLRANRNWRKLWLGQTVSQLGDYVFDVTVLLWVGTVLAKGRPWAPTAVSGVMLAAAVPTVLVGPLAGVFADRWNRKRTMMNADLIRAGVIGLLLLVPLCASALPLWVQLAAVYTAVAGTSVVAQFFNPSRFATIGAVVAEEDRARAFGLSSASANTVSVLGPPLAAPVLFTVGEQWALLVNAVSFLVSYLCIRFTDIPAATADHTGARGDFRRELVEGWSFIRRNDVLATVAVTVFLYLFGVGAVNVLEVFFVSENLRTDPSWLGTLNGALGAGMIVGSLLMARAARRLGERRLFGWGILATALLLFVYARSPSLLFSIGVLGLVGIPLAMVNAVLGPMLLNEIPNRLLGRVNSALNPLVYVASVSSMSLAGILASDLGPDFAWSFAGLHFHRIDTIMTVSSCLMALAGAVAVIRLRTGIRAAPGSEGPAAAAAAPDDA